MAKRRLSLLTAAVLLVVSVGLMLSRHAVLGPEVEGPPGWKVTLQASGQLPGRMATLTTVMPPDFRHQHVAEEKLLSDELRYRIRKSKESGQRRVIWRRRLSTGKTQAFHL